MANSPVINRNERTASIFKVVGLYVLVGILLAILLLWNKGIPGQELSELNQKNSQLAAESDAMKEVIASLDTISGLTRSIFLLENNAIPNLTAGVQSRQLLVNQNSLNEFGNSFANLRDSLSEDTRNDADGIFDAVADMRSKLDSLMGQINTIKAVCEQKIGLDSLNQAMEDLDNLTAMAELQTENASLKSEVATLTRALANCGGGGAAATSADVESLKEDLKVVQEALQEVHRELEGGKRLNNVLASRYQTVIELAYTKLGAALQQLDLLIN